MTLQEIFSKMVTCTIKPAEPVNFKHDPLLSKSDFTAFSSEYKLSKLILKNSHLSEGDTFTESPWRISLLGFIYKKLE